MNESFTSLPELEKRLSANKEEVSDLGTALENAKEELETVQSVVSSLKEALEKAESSLMVVKSKVEEAESRFDKLVGKKLDPQKPLKHFVMQALNQSNEPLTINEIADVVIEAGYKSRASNHEYFRNMVSQVITGNDEFRRVTRPKTRPARYEVT